MNSEKKHLMNVEESRTALRASLFQLLGELSIPKLEEALTHPSVSNETGALSNQRLEFLGDSVLGLCISEALISKFPEHDEGMLTRMRSQLVNTETLAQCAQTLRLGECLLFGKGAKHEAKRVNVLADAFEALIAAIYDAGGLRAANLFVHSVFQNHFENASSLCIQDPKSAYQEAVQALGFPTPKYELTRTLGPPQQLTFEITLSVGERTICTTLSTSKKSAEREAAILALSQIEELRASIPCSTE